VEAWKEDVRKYPGNEEECSMRGRGGTGGSKERKDLTAKKFSAAGLKEEERNARMNDWGSRARDGSTKRNGGLRESEGT